MNVIFCKYINISWTAPCENVSLSIYGQKRSRSDCASAQSDQGLHCPLTESQDDRTYEKHRMTERMKRTAKAQAITFRKGRMIRIGTYCACSKALFRLTWPIWHCTDNRVSKTKSLREMLHTVFFGEKYKTPFSVIPRSVFLLFFFFFFFLFVFRKNVIYAIMTILDNII